MWQCMLTTPLSITLIRCLRDTLLKNDIISESVYKDLFPTGSKPGILYGLPKVHKENCPARPIMSAIGTYNYRLAKFLVPIFQPFSINQYSVYDTFSFFKEITNFKSDTKLCMASFDVSSLFTNIPLDETIDYAVNLVFENSDTYVYNDCSFNKEQLRKLLQLAVKENHFLFNGRLYDQIDGVAMGSPLGPTLANIFMSVLETKFMVNCPSEFKPILYRRYVDDTYCLFEKVEHVEKFLAYLNGQHRNIKFTYEIEEENSLPFLDVLVTWDGSAFVTDLFRKKTFTGLYTDFGSLTPSNYKTNLITVLVYRAFHICSTYISFHKQLLFIKEVLHDNCYPKYLVDRFIKRFLNKHFDHRPKPATVQKMPLCFYMPYLGQISLQLRRKISRLLRKAYPCVDFRVVFRSGRRIEHFCPFKDRIPKNVCSHVVYKYSCSGCQACYIGKHLATC